MRVLVLPRFALVVVVAIQLVVVVVVITLSMHFNMLAVCPSPSQAPAPLLAALVRFCWGTGDGILTPIVAGCVWVGKGSQRPIII